MPTPSEEQVRKFIDEWSSDAAHKRKQKSTKINDYQCGVVDTYEILSKDLQREMKKWEDIHLSIW